MGLGSTLSLRIFSLILDDDDDLVTTRFYGVLTTATTIGKFYGFVIGMFNGQNTELCRSELTTN